MDFKTILAPTDFSPCSRHAVTHAVELAKRFGAEVALLHVFDIPPGLGPATLVRAEDGALVGLRDYLQADARRMVLAEVESLRTDGVTIHPQVAEGRTADAILRAADELKADVIVIGTHGRTGLNRMFMGSVAEHVIRHAKVPVLVVREPPA
jgi:nucleotide-binding universal stress UspA family protein